MRINPPYRYKVKDLISELATMPQNAYINVYNVRQNIDAFAYHVCSTKDKREVVLYIKDRSVFKNTNEI